jgi:hypothetical protein
MVMISTQKGTFTGHFAKISADQRPAEPDS